MKSSSPLHPPKHCRWNSLLMMCKCYIQNSKMLGTCTLACFIAEILITVQYPSTDLRDWSTPIWHRERVLLSPCSQIPCLFLSSPDKEEHTASLTTQEVSQLVFSSNYTYRYVDSITYNTMVPSYISFTDSDASGNCI